MQKHHRDTWSPRDVSPVSYTHLDVYKRQALRLAGAKAVATVLPRALGIKLHDSADPSGERVLVHHSIGANTPLPVEGATFTCATVLNDQDRIRIELMEQAGAVASPCLLYTSRCV